VSTPTLALPHQGRGELLLFSFLWFVGNEIIMENLFGIWDLVIVILISHFYQYTPITKG
jgi:hypothetical protein